MKEQIEILTALCAGLKEQLDDLNRNTMYLGGDGRFVTGREEYVSPYRVLESKHDCVKALQNTLSTLYPVVHEMRKFVAEEEEAKGHYTSHNITG